MNYDGFVTRCMRAECDARLIGARVERIHQPDAQTLRLDFRRGSDKYHLLFAMAGNHPAVYLGSQLPENPSQPPHFCMVLRKHLLNARLQSVEQVGLDRVLEFHFQTYDELGERSTMRLVAELMGRHSNVFLLDASDTVIESLRRVGYDVSRVRPVYPGSSYARIPSGKRNLLQDDSALPEGDARSLSKWLVACYEGFGPVAARELLFDANLDPLFPAAHLDEAGQTRLLHALERWKERAEKDAFVPVRLEEDGQTVGYAPIPLQHLPVQSIPSETMSAAIEDFRLREGQQRQTPQPDELLSVVRQRIERAHTKLERMREEFVDSQDRATDLLYADLLSASAHDVPRGAREVTLANLFDEEQAPICIPLDEKKNVWQNAQAYYKKHTKKKNREQALRRQLPQSESELAYLLQVHQSLLTAESGMEIAEIRQELENAGVVKRQRKKKKPQGRSEPLHFTSSDGMSILVGKNNRQNDVLTHRTAARDDVFFHAKDIPGSHVIVRAGGRELSEQTIREAAYLAAHFSSEKNSDRVLVDWTEKKYVRKPKGAQPGMVLYDHFRTVTVDPTAPMEHLQAKK